MRRVAIIGASGFLGRALEQWVSTSSVCQQIECFGLVRTLRNCGYTGAVQYTCCQEYDTACISKFVHETQPHFVVNLVGMFRNHNFTQLMHVNVGITRILFEALLAQKCPTEKIVVMGSAAEYGRPNGSPIREVEPLNPISPYGLTKKFQTELAHYYVRNHGLPVVVARAFNILGDGQSADLAIGSFLKKIEVAEFHSTLTVGNIDQIRDYLRSELVAQHLWTLLLRGAPGEIYNVCSGLPTSMRAVLEEMIFRSEKQLIIESQSPCPITDIPTVVGDPQKLQRLYNQ